MRRGKFDNWITGPCSRRLALWHISSELSFRVNKVALVKCLKGLTLLVKRSGRSQKLKENWPKFNCWFKRKQISWILAALNTMSISSANASHS